MDKMTSPVPNLSQIAEEIWHWITGADRNMPSSEVINYIATALDQTREEGKREGVEEAAKIGDRCKAQNCRCGKNIRALASGTGEGK